jgi:hypothetical protein
MANVKLSDAELLLVCNEEFILTKNAIINKVFVLFGALSENFVAQLKDFQNVFPEALRLFPKIYKGENYKGLPYVTLDYPRYFSKEKTFAVRCFFWWGNFFSITFHLSGEYAKTYTSEVLKILQQNNSWYICINEDQWEHHFNSDNYQLINADILNELNNKMPQEISFLKIAKKIPLQNWDEAYDFFTSSFKEIFCMIT